MAPGRASAQKTARPRDLPERDLVPATRSHFGRSRREANGCDAPENEKTKTDKKEKKVQGVKVLRNLWRRLETGQRNAALGVEVLSKPGTSPQVSPTHRLER